MHIHFQILLRGLLGVVIKPGSGSSIFEFYFSSSLERYMRCPPPPPLLPLFVLP
jgi:hypothetical protein